MAEPEDMGAGRKPIAFISHHSSQEQTARHLKGILERNGIEGWMAPDDVEPGRPFDQAIIEEVEKCDLIVLLFCSQSDQSRHVKRELMMAENHNKLIYPVRLEDIDAKGLAYWLNDYQWIDWMDQRDETIMRLIDTIKRQVDTEEPVDAEESVAAALPGQDSLDDEVSVADTSDEALSDNAAPPPVDATPMAAMSVPPAFEPDGDDAKPGISTGAWFVIGGIAIFAAIVLAIIVNAALGGGDDERSRGADRSASSSSSSSSNSSRNASGNSGDVTLKAGNWRTSVAFTDVQMPGATPEMLEMLRNQMATTSQTQTECMNEAEAADPESAMMLGIQMSSECEVTRSTFANGEIDLRAQCAVPGMDGDADLVIAGGFDQSSIDADMTMTMQTPGGPMTMTGDMTAQRLGDCN